MDSNSSSIQTIVVLSVTGTVIATDADGNTRVLQPGDTIYPGETVTTSDGEAILLAPGGETFSIQPGQPFFFPATGLNPTTQKNDETAKSDEIAKNEDDNEKVSQENNKPSVSFHESNETALSEELNDSDTSVESEEGDGLLLRDHSGLGAPAFINAQVALDKTNDQDKSNDQSTATSIWGGTSEYSSPVSLVPLTGTVYQNSPIDLGMIQTVTVSPQPSDPQITTANKTVTVSNGSRLLEQTSVLTGNINIDEGTIITQVNGAAIATSGPAIMQGQYGTLTIQADGSYSYTPEEIDLHSDMVASWQFNEAAGATVAADSSLTDFITDNATLSGNAFVVSGGLDGNALQLNSLSPPTFSNATLLSRFSMENITAGATSISNDAGTGIGTSSGGAFTAGTSDSPQGSGHLELDGTEHLNINTGLDSSATDITLSFWLNWDGSDNKMLASFGDYDIWIRDGRIGFNTFSWDIYGQEISELQLAPGSSGLANEWHMITATFHDGDPTQSVLRIDGITQQMEEHDLTGLNPLAGLLGHPEANSGYSYNATNADIHQTLNFGGYDHPDSVLGIQGGVDDLQIFSGTMSDAEAAALYQASASSSVHIEDTQEINIPADGVIEARTITLAFQPDGSNDLSGRQILYEEGGEYSGLIIYIHDNTLYAGAYSTPSGWSGEFLSTSLASLDSSQFHRITLSLDSTTGTMTAWLDGNQIGQSTSAQSVSAHSGNISFGSSSSDSADNIFHDGAQSGTFSYSGLIDDVRIYDRAFTNAEVQALVSNNESQTETFTYTTIDSNGQTATETLDITVQNPQKQGPDANSDTLNVGADQQAAVNSLLSTGLLGNDTDAEGDPLTVIQIGDTAVANSGTTSINGQYGTLIVAADGSYSYVPLNSAIAGGTETFSYTVSNGTSTSTAQLTVNVIASAGAASDSVSIRESAIEDTATYVVIREVNDGILNYFDSATGETQRLGALTGGAQSAYEVSISMSPSGVMYGIDSTNLYTIDPATQAMTIVGAHGINVFSMTGLAVTPAGAIYATGYNGHVYTIDASTGAATDLGILSGVDGNFSDLAWHNGALYTSFYNYDEVTLTPTAQLTRINITGSSVTATPIGSASTYSDTTQVFYSTGEHLIINNSIVDTSTGALTPLSNGLSGTLVSGSGNAVYSDVEGNVLSNDTDMQSVTSILDVNGNPVSVTASGATVRTTYGEITIQSDGSYTYSLDNDAEQVDNLTDGETANDRFVYTAVDSNGVSAQAVLTVHINGSHELAVVETTIVGNGTADVLIGGMDNDSITGGGSNDLLTGGGGIDFFTWTSGDEGTTDSPAVDTITDFSVGAQGDVLDLTDMLPENAAGHLDEFLSISSDNGSTTIGVSTTAGGEAVQKIVLDNVDLTSVYGTTDVTTLINNLTNDGNLQT